MADHWLLVRLAPMFALSCCANIAAAPDRFGVVDVTAREHAPCATFSTAVARGERVKIILLPSQEVLGASVTTPIAECGFGQAAGHAYRLELDGPAQQVHGSIAARGELPGSISFRQCAGSEALHLTAWVDGGRIWHGFYYLGYDVEPDCRPEDISD